MRVFSIRIDEPADLRVVITALQVIEPGLNSWRRGMGSSQAKLHNLCMRRDCGVANRQYYLFGVCLLCLLLKLQTLSHLNKAFSSAVIVLVSTIDLLSMMEMTHSSLIAEIQYFTSPLITNASD